MCFGRITEGIEHLDIISQIPLKTDRKSPQVNISIYTSLIIYDPIEKNNKDFEEIPSPTFIKVISTE